MTSPSLIFGAVLLAFSPGFSLLVLLVSPKPQLVILAVCAAFAYLLAALLSSLFWLAISAIGKAVSGEDELSPTGTLLALAIPGVACQMAARCAFAVGYFRVEDAIRRSVAKHEEEERVANARANSNGASNGTSNDPNNIANHDENANGDGEPSETNALQLQLNDLSCSVAGGTGYSLMHSLFLYGTLLASEAGESGSYVEGAYAGGGGSTGYGGTLYQESCAGIPSLINGALIACMFSVLDVLWMMLCFYGMRRRSQTSTPSDGTALRPGGSTAQSFFGGITCQGLPDSKSGGNAAILLVTATHLAASLVLAPNGGGSGCKVSLPLLGGVVIWVALALRKVAAKGQFLPEDQRRRIQGMRLGLRAPGERQHVD